MLKEFREFIEQGNVLDTAVGLVLALAFKAIIDSVVEGFIMPLVGAATSGYDLNAWKIVLRPEANGQAEVAIMIGTIIQAIITFLIVAFILFLIVKAMNASRRLKKAEPTPAEPEAPAADILLLTEIRDLLANK